MSLPATEKQAIKEVAVVNTGQDWSNVFCKFGDKYIVPDENEFKLNIVTRENQVVASAILQDRPYSIIAIDRNTLAVGDLSGNVYVYDDKMRLLFMCHLTGTFEKGVELSKIDGTKFAYQCNPEAGIIDWKNAKKTVLEHGTFYSFYMLGKNAVFILADPDSIRVYNTEKEERVEIGHRGHWMFHPLIIDSMHFAFRDDQVLGQDKIQGNICILDLKAKTAKRFPLPDTMYWHPATMLDDKRLLCEGEKGWLILDTENGKILWRGCTKHIFNAFGMTPSCVPCDYDHGPGVEIFNPETKESKILYASETHHSLDKIDETHFVILDEKKWHVFEVNV